ncbi:hypothetical protein GGQ84_002797 [Desulfitispora alkaliphila]|uniref:hypothetical protein n=1 Tax=Desulfitispora alkaliphila TaxID=622674 RepID=UPI003D1E2A8C
MTKVCQQLPDKEFDKLLDQFFQEPDNQIVEAKVKAQLLRFPNNAFSYLFFNYFMLQGKVNQYQLEKRLFPLAHDVYLGIMIFINRLYSIELNQLNFESLDGEEAENIRFQYVKRFSRAMLLKALGSEKVPLTGKNRIKKTLEKMLTMYKVVQANKLKERLPFDNEEVLGQLNRYLNGADVLADAPEFITTYFSSQELEPIIEHLRMRKINAFSRRYLERLIDENKKKQINRVLQKIIFEQPEINHAKKAYVIYITLNNGADNSWVDHPFMRRFILNSYLENAVEELEAKGK